VILHTYTGWHQNDVNVHAQAAVLIAHKIDANAANVAGLAPDVKVIPTPHCIFH
jgi:hypothetical protein